MEKTLLAIVASRVAVETSAAWSDAFRALEQDFSSRRFHSLFAGAGRTLGTAPVMLDSGEAAGLRSSGGPSALVAWSVDHAGRVALILLAGRALDPITFGALLDDLFYRGENREREAVLRALFYVPEPERFSSIAAEACRSNVRTVFEAIACENPYPARFFSDAQFFQMVLKAIFLGTSVERIDGLARRATIELSRMVEGYASERRAAGRVVSDDCARVAALASEKTT